MELLGAVPDNSLPHKALDSAEVVKTPKYLPVSVMPGVVDDGVEGWVGLDCAGDVPLAGLEEAGAQGFGKGSVFSRPCWPEFSVWRKKDIHALPKTAQSTTH